MYLLTLTDLVEFWHEMYLACGEVIQDAGPDNMDTLFMNEARAHKLWVLASEAVTFQNTSKDKEEVEDLYVSNEAFIREMSATELELDDGEEWYVLTFPGTKMVQYIVPMGYFPDSEGPMDVVNKTPFISYQHAYRWAEACMYVGWYDREQKRLGNVLVFKLPSWDEIFERFSI